MKQFTNMVFRDRSGFTLIELLVYMAILGVLMTAIMSSFINTLQGSAKQSSIAETKIETIIGMNLLRIDLEHAGFGLPWQFPTPPNPYSEPGGAVLGPLADAPNNPPRALISIDAAPAANSLNNADYLVIKATNVTRGNTGQKWGQVSSNSVQSMINAPNQPVDPTLQINNNDRLIVLRPINGSGELRQLVMNGANYIAQTNNAGTTMTAGFAPDATPNDPDGERFLVYGLNDDAQISRPFNRADYYINNANIPEHCAPNTGVLVKATLNQANNNFGILPIMDCVADFQIVYYLDTDGDGGWDQRAEADGLDGLTAAQIRDRLKSIRFFVLTHEGRVDRDYTHPNVNVNVGEVTDNGNALLAGRVFDLNAFIGGDWANYRWKVESMAITPKNLK